MQKRQYRRERESSRDVPILHSKKGQFFIPSCIFNRNLSSFEAIVKYLKEGYDLKLQQIADLLGKSKQSVWRANKLATTSQPESFHITDLHYLIPVEIFSSKTPLTETLVSFLHDEQQLTFSEIAALLQRDQRTIWTLYNRAVQRTVQKKNKTRKHVKAKK